MTSCAIYWFNRSKALNSQHYANIRTSISSSANLRSKASVEIADLLKTDLSQKLHFIHKMLASDIGTEEKIRLISEQVEAMIADEEEKKPYLEAHEELKTIPDITPYWKSAPASFRIGFLISSNR